jgi:glycine/D-amino acid oxidase-like deaminating enzyme
MKRRGIIGLTVGGGLTALSGCGSRDEGGETGGVSAAPVPGPALNSGHKKEGLNLVPVRVEEGLEIRTISGLRPYRPSGFVVRREDLSGKVLIHNYGHGGGGFSLSWGSAKLAVDLAGDVGGKECAVVGGGVMGLSVGRLLQQRGARVTIFAKDLPPETTSNVAGAQWWPFSVFDNSCRTPEFSEQYVRAAEFSWRYFQGFTGP